MLKKILLFLFLFSQVLFSNVKIDNSNTNNLNYEQVKLNKINAKIESFINNENDWFKNHDTYITALQVSENLKNIKDRIKYLKENLKDENKNELKSLMTKEKILSLELKKNITNETPFIKLITPPEIEKIVEISNPIEMINGYLFLKTLDKKYKIYKKKKDELSNIVSLLIQQNELSLKLKKPVLNNKKRLEDFQTALDTFNITEKVYKKRLDLVKLKTNKQIDIQVKRVTNISIIIFIVIILFIFLKLIVKKYIEDNERFYMANKIITFFSVTLIILILLFSYIEETTYLTTILGFASAGIAIAMKDWFMSLLGWLVIVIGGSIHVGDRVRVDLDGMKYVGDILDISLLRMTILEDITLTSIHTNRRAGRIIFIPNNYIFTKMIANYTHHTLKTVWDGVKITITFDSNHKKAINLAKEVVKKYSKGYTDITRTQLNKLRTQYSLKNTNVEPRIFSFIVENGVSIDSWYLTNAYATLTLRSVISLEIIKAFNKEDDIKIAFPIQELYLNGERKPPFKDNGTGDLEE